MVLKADSGPALLKPLALSGLAASAAATGADGGGNTASGAAATETPVISMAGSGNTTNGAFSCTPRAGAALGMHSPRAHAQLTGAGVYTSGGAAAAAMEEGPPGGCCMPGPDGDCNIAGQQS